MISRTDIEDMTDAQDELSDAIGLILSATPEGEPWRASDFGTYPLDCTPTDTAIATILNAVVSGDLARPSQAGDERVAIATKALERIDQLARLVAHDLQGRVEGGKVAGVAFGRVIQAGKFSGLLRYAVSTVTRGQLPLQRLANLHALADGEVGAQTRGGQTFTSGKFSLAAGSVGAQTRGGQTARPNRV